MATAARLALAPILGGRHPFATFYVAAWFAARYGGSGPCVLAVVLGSLLADYLFIAPAYSLRIADDADLLGLAFFAVAGLAVVLLGGDRRAGQEGLGREVEERDAAATERMRSERAIRDGEERLRLAHEAACMGNWDYDIASGRVAWSPGLEAMHGLAPGTFAGTFDAFLGDILPEDRDGVVRTIARTIEEGEDHFIEYRFRHPDGSVRWVEGRGRLHRDEGGKPTRLLGVCMEVTRRKRAEEALREADRRKDEFLATLAHELRNPLAPIRTGLQILKHREGDNPAVEPLRAMMDRQAGHLARLVDDLMDVSRISHGAVVLRKEVVGLASVVDRTVAAIRPLIDERGHELTVTLPDEDERLEADPTRLEQILGNLLENAAKYTDPGGHIRLEARRDGDEIVIGVKDTGIGIDPEVLTKVFEMFVQFERRLDRSQGGLGIGLSLVKSLVELHGGTVAVHSEGPGKGTEFVVRLPAVAGGRGDGRGPTPLPRTEPNHGPARRRVLVVDDNQDAADSLAKYLSRVMGQQVEVAYDGPGAVEVAGTFRPDVVLLDIGLPGMSGYEVARTAAGRSRDRGRDARRPDRVGAGGGPAAVEGGGDRFPPREAGGPRRHQKPTRRSRVY